MTCTRLFSIAFLISLFSIGPFLQSASAHDSQENIEVKASRIEPPEVTIQKAKRQIRLIQGDPGYYYSGAWGATHRIHDVQQQREVIAQAEADSGRLPSSTQR